nr:hypothetical protein [Richelia sinica]
MKFSVKSIYPPSISISATNSLINWEFAVARVEYLFMGDGSRDPRHSTEGDDDFAYFSIDGLNRKPLVDITSGRCR